MLSVFPVGRHSWPRGRVAEMSRFLHCPLSRRWCRVGQAVDIADDEVSAVYSSKNWPVTRQTLRTVGVLEHVTVSPQDGHAECVHIPPGLAIGDGMVRLVSLAGHGSLVDVC